MSQIEKLHRAQEAKRAKRARNSRPRGGHKPYTDEEKAAKRAEHAERLDAALADVATPEGAVEWLRSRAYNPTLSPANVALAAYQLPGEMVLTMAAIKAMGGRVKKGQRSSGRISGKTGWPVAVWTATELECSEWIPREALAEPDPHDAIRLAAAVDLAYREFGRSVKAFRAAIEAAGFGEEEKAA